MFPPKRTPQPAPNHQKPWSAAAFGDPLAPETHSGLRREKRSDAKVDPSCFALLDTKKGLSVESCLVHHLLRTPARAAGPGDHHEQP